MGGMLMNKKDLVEKVAQVTGLSLRQSGDAIDSALDAIKGTMKKGNKVTLVGFGTFSVNSKKARKGRNPRTGEEINIAARKTPKFTAGKALKDALK
jgi:DNA-binding protein HU-beta